MTIKVLKVIGLALLAILLGFSVLICFFTFFIYENPAITLPGFFLIGLIIGSINPKWWLMAGLTAWPGPLVVISSLLGGEEITLEHLEGLLYLIPLGPAFLGGYVGRLLRTIRL